jgi:hypothetical protein
MDVRITDILVRLLLKAGLHGASNLEQDTCSLASLLALCKPALTLYQPQNTKMGECLITNQGRTRAAQFLSTTMPNPLSLTYQQNYPHAP